MIPLSLARPELAAQWHPTKNGTLTPDQVGTGYGGKVWWKCPAGPDRDWEATPRKRAYTGHGCPFCSNRRVSATNTLAARFPELAAQWHPTRNGELTPEQIVGGTNRKAWWQCSRELLHEWQATIASRTGRGTGCPFCAGRRKVVTNEFLSRYAELTTEWEREHSEPGAYGVKLKAPRKVQLPPKAARTAAEKAHSPTSRTQRR